ncbi:MAG: sigma-70 family RNA polymerase sigma factor [Euzebyales bacterium]|nr:sigma-70 family RNA polymerase sigma factor [Euzebyales bacterium]
MDGGGPAPPAPTDEELVAAFVAGDGTAFDALVDRYARRVYGICLRYFGDPADAEDAAQETFVALLRRAGTFRGGAAFSTWLYRVATNACNDLARKRARRPRSDGRDVEALRDTADVDDALANRELGMELAAALDGLDPSSRQAILLHDVYGLPYAEVAQRLGWPVGTVKSRIARGHGRLASALTHLRGSAEPGREPSAPAKPPTVHP